MDTRYIVITSDEHSPPTLDRGAWASRPEIRGDFEHAAEFVTDWCDGHANEGIVRISCADTLDSFEPEPDRLRWLSEYFKEQLEYCQAYYYIQGQHDRVARCPNVPWLSVICENPKMQYAHRRVIEISGRQFVFHDQTSAPQLMAFIQGVSPQLSGATLIAHQLWHPWLPATRMVPSLKALPPQIYRVFSGDYHVQKEERMITASGAPLDAWSVGPLHIQDISEPNNCRFLVIDCRDWSVQSIPIPSRQVLKFEIQTDDHLDAFVAEMAKLPVFHDPLHIKKPIVKVRYLTLIDQAHRRITDACHLKAHLFPDPAAAVQELNVYDVYSKGNSQDVQYCLDASGKVPRGSVPRQIVDTILDAASPAELTARLDALRDAFLEGDNAIRENASSEVLPVHQ